MEQINKFVTKYGMIILIIISLLNFFNSCGTKSSIKQTNKRIDNVVKRDSINMEIQSIETEISTLKTAREVVYTNNAIVRTSVRPDDVMNQYSIKIDELQKKLDKLKNGK
jgi:DNA replication protein DnaD